MNALSIPMPNLNVVGSHLLILATVCLMILIEALRPRKDDGASGYAVPLVGVAGSVLAMVYLALTWNVGTIETFSGMVVLDRYATFFNGVILIGTILTILVSMNYLRKEQAPYQGEFYILTLSAAFGMMLLASSKDLLVIFLGLEIMSIAIYVLAGFITRRLQCNESALKYFLLGAFATGFLLYGIALLYGASGSTHLSKIAAVPIAKSPMAMVGMGFLLVGLGFKIASFPFHMWTPDVYDGAPVSVTGFMAVGVKAAAFAALLRVVLDLFGPMQVAGYWILWGMAILTMTYGNFAALAQRNIKRMLAYSSIAHTGYLLVGLTAIVRARSAGAEGILYYLLAYTFMNIGAFGVVAYLARKDETAFDLESYNGLSVRNPVLAVAMGVFMFSLAGIPPLAGFFGKFYVFSAAVKSNLIDLAIIGVLNSALSVYYYIRVVWYMYFRDPAEGALPLPAERSNALALAIAAGFTLLLGILPAFWVNLAKDSIVTVVNLF